MNLNIDFAGLLIFIIIVAGVLGWALIELLLWLFSFITITFGG